MCLQSVGGDADALKLSEDAGEEGEWSRSIILQSATEAGTQDPGPKWVEGLNFICTGGRPDSVMVQKKVGGWTWSREDKKLLFDGFCLLSEIKREGYQLR